MLFLILLVSGCSGAIGFSLGRADRKIDDILKEAGPE
jgi:hypothetical protein